MHHILALLDDFDRAGIVTRSELGAHLRGEDDRGDPGGEEAEDRDEDRPHHVVGHRGSGGHRRHRCTRPPSARASVERAGARSRRGAVASPRVPRIPLLRSSGATCRRPAPATRLLAWTPAPSRGLLSHGPASRPDRCGDSGSDVPTVHPPAGASASLREARPVALGYFVDGRGVPARRRVHRDAVRRQPALRRPGDARGPLRPSRCGCSRWRRTSPRPRSSPSRGPTATACGSSRRRPSSPSRGIPTIGTAFTLASEGRTSPRTVQTTALGDVPVEVDLERGFAWMTQQPPVVRRDVRRPRGRRGGRGARARRPRPRPPDAGDLDGPRARCSCRSATRRRSGGPSGTSPRAGARRRPRAASASTCSRSAATATCSRGCSTRPSASARIPPPARPPVRSASTSRPAASPACRATAVVAQGEMVGRPSFLHLDVRPDADSWLVRVGGGVRIVGEGVFRVPAET